MSISGVSSTQSPFVGGLVASRYVHHQGDGSAAKAAIVSATTSTSTDSAGQLAAAIASALVQLGLTATPATASRGMREDAADSDSSLDAPSARQPAQQQVQQYRDVASPFSNLAQALGSSASGMSSAAGGSGQLSSVFQSLWTSLGAGSPATSDGASSDGIPSLPTFVQSLAKNLGESGLSGLRGMFVDTVV